MREKLIAFVLTGVAYAHCTQAQVSAANATSGASAGSNQGSGSSGVTIYSPDLFSGTVNVNIPIYSFSIDGLDLGVSVSYNTLGIKVDQVASNVGLGWTLNTGGMITRQAHGIEDELRETGIDTLDLVSSIMRPAVIEQRGNWVDSWDALPTTHPDDYGAEEPDVFTAQIGGRTIDFSIYNWSGAPGPYSQMTLYTSPKRDIQVDVFFDDINIYSVWTGHRVPLDVESAGSVKVMRFKITDEFGNQFFFDRGEYQVRMYRYETFRITVPTPPMVYYVPNSWYLKKVVTYTGAVINYTYEDDSYSYPLYRNQMVKEQHEFFDPGSTSTTPVVTGRIDVIDEEVNAVMGSQRLKKIEYPNGDVLTFNADGNARRDRSGGSTGSTQNAAVSSITIQKGYDATVMSSFIYRFNYAYFNSDAGTPEVPYPSGPSADPLHNLRLKLKGIDKIGCDGITTENYYAFDYENHDVLPPRLSGRTDCYGYFNGSFLSSGAVVTTSPSSTAYSGLSALLTPLTVPYHSGSFVDNDGVRVNYTYGTSKNPNWLFASTCLLNKITNGMGGSIEFSYKDHNLANVQDFIGGSSIFSWVNTGYWDRGDILSYGPIAPPVTPAPYGPLPDMDYKDANDGVCIDKIVFRDGFNNDNTTTTTFDFSDGSGGAGGVRFFPCGYFWYPDELGANIMSPGMPIGSIPQITNIFQNSFVTPMEFINGANHGYSHARVTTTGYGGGITSDKAYTFTNLEPQSGETVTNYSGTPPVPTATYSPNWCRLNVRYGLLTHLMPRTYFDKQYLGLVKELDEFDNAGHLLSKTVNTYDKRLYTDDSLFANITQGIVCWGTSGFPNVNQQYTLFTKSMVNLVSSTTSDYSGGGLMQTTKSFTYDNGGSLTSTTSTDSKGHSTQEINIYTGAPITQVYGTYSDVVRTFNVKYLQAKDVIINSLHCRYSDVTTDYNLYTDAVTNWWDGLGNLRNSDYSTCGSCQPIKVTGSLGVLRFNKVHTFFAPNPVSTLSDPYKLETKHFRIFDDHNNVLETGYNNDQNFSCSIWDTRIGEKVADVANATYAEIACTSFEGGFLPSGTADYNKGNWDFDPSHVTLGPIWGAAITGRYYYDLSGGTIRSFIAPSVKPFNISFWYQGTMPVVTVGTVVSLTSQITVRGWTLATGTFLGNGSSAVQVSSTGSTLIDELRLAPADASIETSTFEPLLGVSSRCNERNNIQYYEYDAMGRPFLTRDINWHITSLTKHVINGSDY